ncbi:purine catabolism regulatory protein [Carnobacterium iners]|uniref:Purine catabolism regulatory protein n=1 Tax=Carnobacterium iners TaxID=1073423 RepID=A0A1X7MQC5_9LACT|nr:PucR family transcriptional regulator [Carnobacterium iners]SEL09141.1 purine catabolism regulatory protein [Carnobacterium iners]SMH26548.1 purine catabolism regulatory protein [Carnobacterium iners]
MATIVKDILKLKGFSGAKVVAGENGLINIVKKATLMEVPDIGEFLEENSLIITTLYPIINNAEAMKSIIPKSSAASAAGICIKTGRYIETIPESMLKQANELNFPIIEIHSDENLSDLASEIIKFSLDQHISALQFQREVHNQLMNMFLKGENVNAMIDSFSDLVDHPVILLDVDTNLISQSRSIDKTKLTIHLLDKKVGIDSLVVKHEDKVYTSEDFINYSIEAQANKFAYLILLDGDKKNRNLLVAVEEASLLLASVFYKNHAVAEKERNFQDSFIRDILQGTNYSQLVTIEKAKIYGWEMEFPEVIFVLKLFNKNELTKMRDYEKILHSQIIENILKRELITTNKKIKVTYIDGSLVLFVNVAFINNSKEKMKAIGNSLIRKLGDDYPIGIGISNPVLNSLSFPATYKEAKDSWFIGRKLKQACFVSHYDDNELFSVIKEVQDTKVLDKYVERKLGDILAYDQKVNMDLLKTLMALIETQFNHKEAAKKLFIHYNTLRYRINRLKELGINIDDGLEIAEIVLAHHINMWTEIDRRE